MVVRSLDVKKDSFRHCEKGEELLGLEVSHLSVFVHLCILLTVLAHIYIFFVNLLARYSYALTQRYWNDIKHILRYLQGKIDMSLFYSTESKQQLLEYADVGYLSDPQKPDHKQGMCLIIVELLFHGDI